MVDITFSVTYVNRDKIRRANEIKGAKLITNLSPSENEVNYLFTDLNLGSQFDSIFYVQLVTSELLTG